MQAIDENKIDSNVLRRKLNTLANLLPQNMEEAPESQDYSDSLLNLQMSVLTKSVQLSKDLVEKVGKVGGFERRFMSGIYL